MKHLQWLFGRAGINIYLEEADPDGGQGGGAPGGDNTPPGDKTPENKPGETQPSSDGEGDDGKDKSQGGKPGLSDTEAELLRDVMKHKGRSKELEAKLKEFSSVMGDLSPTQVKELIDAQRERERVDLEKRGEYDRVLEQVRTQHASEVAALNEQIASLQTQLQESGSAVQEMTIGRAFSESAFIRERSLIPASIARKEFGAHVELADGAVVVYDKPKGAAERTPLVDANGKPKSFEEAIAQLYQSHSESAQLLRSSVKPGAGSKTGDAGGTPPAGGAPAGTEIKPGISRISNALKKQSK